MPAFTDLAGLAGLAVAAAAACTSAPLSGRKRAACAILAAILALVPLGGLPPAAYLRGVTGDLSLTSVLLLLRFVLARHFGWSPADARERLALQILIASAAVVLYPLALGFGPFDPYRLGFANPWLIGALTLAALAAWRAGLLFAALCIALALLAWTLGWYESENVWDYLLDPLLSAWALGALALRGWRRLLSKAAALRQPRSNA
jgi:hypothetical protein